jgi:hypothetical protein
MVGRALSASMASQATVLYQGQRANFPVFFKAFAANSANKHEATILPKISRKTEKEDFFP